MPKIPEIDKLRTPQSPAFVILGTAPTVVERPGTPSAVALSLLSTLQGAQPTIPKELALEVAPYWLWSHPSLTLRDIEAQETGSRTGFLARAWNNIRRTFTVGLATADSSFRTSGPQPVDTSVFRVGFSGHMTPFRGRLVDGCIDAIEQTLTQMSARINAGLRAAIVENANLGAAEIEALNQRLLAEGKKALDAELSAPQRACLSARRGFLLDFAAAGAARFPQQTFTKGELSAHAYWATLGYDWNAATLVGVARAGKEGSDGRRLGQSYRDVGGRVIGKWDAYALSTEIVSRHTRDAGETDNLWRVNVGFDFKVASGMWIGAAFGRDFRASEARSVLALANVQWNFGGGGIKPPSAQARLSP